MRKKDKLKNDLYENYCLVKGDHEKKWKKEDFLDNETTNLCFTIKIATRIEFVMRRLSAVVICCQKSQFQSNNQIYTYCCG